MRLSSILIVGLVFAFAAFASALGAMVSAQLIENRSQIAVSDTLDQAGLDWANVQATGLQVVLTGTAPDEATRFRALSTAGTIVDAARVMDEMDVESAAQIIAPEFSIELLRNDSGISLLGLIPAEVDREDLVARVQSIGGNTPVADLLEVADYPKPDNWDIVVDYGLDALSRLDRSKVSISRQRLVIVSAAESLADKNQLESFFARRKPDGVELRLQITAPRPVISPYTVRFLIDDSGARFDACAANDIEMRAEIAVAAAGAGISEKIECPLGLGMPSPRWGEATAKSIDALAQIGAGTVTLADTEVTLIAAPNTPQATFDTVVGVLENALPPIFRLTAVLPDPVEVDGTGEGTGAPEFVATRSPEGQVQLRGRLPDELVKSSAESYALARFGIGNVSVGTRLDDTLPKGWSMRVLAGIAALAELENGSVVVQEDFVEVRGNTGNPRAKAEISRLLSSGLGEGENFGLKVTYVEALDPVASIPTDKECLEAVGTILAAQKINFEPGSTNIDAGGLGIISKIADTLKTCPEAKLEIGGHTDSQGSDELNARISRERAQAVKQTLQDQRVNTTRMLVEGYGESEPIGDNQTEAGREANRRIVFTLIEPEPTQETQTGLEAVEADATNETSDETTNE